MLCQLSSLQGYSCDEHYLLVFIIYFDRQIHGCGFAALLGFGPDKVDIIQTLSFFVNHLPVLIRSNIGDVFILQP